MFRLHFRTKIDLMTIFMIRDLRLKNLLCDVVFFFFFFQAEDGIRDLTVTGVQTCALPIWKARLVIQYGALGSCLLPRKSHRDRTIYHRRREYLAIGKIIIYGGMSILIPDRKSVV